jgi:hypothetical protein
MRKLIFFTFLLLSHCAPEGVLSGDSPDEDALKKIKILVLEKTNKIRQDQNLNAFIPNDEMDALAKYHSDNMVKFIFFPIPIRMAWIHFKGQINSDIHLQQWQKIL